MAVEKISASVILKNHHYRAEVKDKGDQRVLGLRLEEKEDV